MQKKDEQVEDIIKKLTSIKNSNNGLKYLKETGGDSKKAIKNDYFNNNSLSEEQIEALKSFNIKLANESYVLDNIILEEKAIESILIDKIIDKLEDNKKRKISKKAMDNEETDSLLAEYEARHLLISELKNLSNVYDHSMEMLSSFVYEMYVNDPKFKKQSKLAYNREKLFNGLSDLIYSLYDNYSVMNEISKNESIMNFQGKGARKFFITSKMALDKVSKLVALPSRSTENSSKREK